MPGFGKIKTMQTRQELEQENARIQAELAQIRAELLDKEAALEAKDCRLKSKDHLIDQLKEALILARNRQFAKSTEALRSLQSELFDEVEVLINGSADQDTGDDDDGIKVAAHTRQTKGGRQRLPEDLPKIEIVHDLADDDKVCAQGHALVPMGDKVSEQLDIIPMQMRVLRHIRKQYHCPCCDGVIKTAPKPNQPIEKSQASAGLLSYIAVSKYADSLPLYRQSQILKRFAIEMNRTTLANWMIACGQLIQPLMNRLEEQLLSEPVIHMDETPVQVLNEAGKAATSKSYMWVRYAVQSWDDPPDGKSVKKLPNSKVILFNYDPSRSGAVPVKLLQAYEGALMVDGYEGYNAVCQTQAINRLGCWVHARRKFVEVGKASKKKNPQANYVIKRIAKLYKIEKAVKDSTPDARYQARQEHAKPIIDKLRSWLDDTRPKVPPKTALGKALYYLNSQWPRLIQYLEDGQYPIDNNPVENAIRPFTLGRKNWLFSASVRGVNASANLYSLIETAKANDLEPYSYLKHVLTEIPNAESFDDIDKLLPCNVKDVL